MWPDYPAPSRLPAPRISRSRIAILKPDREIGELADGGARPPPRKACDRSGTGGAICVGTLPTAGRPRTSQLVELREPRARSTQSTTRGSTVGMSRPLSTIVVHTSASCSRSQNSCTHPLEPATSSICPVRDGDPGFGVRRDRARRPRDVLDVLGAEFVHVEHLSTLTQEAPSARIALLIPSHRSSV